MKVEPYVIPSEDGTAEVNEEVLEAAKTLCEATWETMGDHRAWDVVQMLGSIVANQIYHRSGYDHANALEMLGELHRSVVRNLVASFRMNLEEGLGLGGAPATEQKPH